MHTRIKNENSMNKRDTLEEAIIDLQRLINTAPPDTPDAVRKSWHEELTDLEFELNNLSDGDEDNNL